MPKKAFTEPDVPLSDNLCYQPMNQTIKFTCLMKSYKCMLESFNKLLTFHSFDYLIEK